MRGKPNIIKTIAPYVRLRKCGREHVGLCPFHADKHPSFSVNEAKGVFLCRSCGAAGDVIRFIELADHVDFKGALKILGLKGNRKPARRIDTRKHQAAAILAQWLSHQHLLIGVRCRELSHQIALAQQANDLELVQYFTQAWKVLSDLHEDLQRPEYAAEFWQLRDAIESLTAGVEIEPPSEFPPWTTEYAAYIAAHLPPLEQPC